MTSLLVGSSPFVPVVGLLALLSPMASSQGDPCPPPCTPIASCFPGDATLDGGPFFEAWVDPVSGDDSAAQVSNSGTNTVATAQAAPFKRIQAAIDAIDLLTCVQQPVITMPGIVHLMPGVYDPSTQSMPIFLKNGINLQGAGARHCVLKTGGPRLRVFYPTGTCFFECGEEDTRNVILDLSLSITTNLCVDPPPAEYSEAIDGVTFFGGDVQVFCGNEYVGVHTRISNCLFDMLHRPTGEPGPDFGILVNHRYQTAPGPDGDHYVAGMVDVFNNTFIQGWARSSSIKLSARPDSMAICDVTVPPDDHGAQCELYYKGRMRIANNLFRSLSGDSFHRSAMPFIPGEETVVLDEDCTDYDTNIFREPDDTNPTYCVVVPVDFRTSPSSATAFKDPAFVGEMMTSLFAFPATVGRDWRIMPDSDVIDRGRAPDACGRLSFQNGFTYVEPSKELDCSYSPIDSFDYDGEGYGNPRVSGARLGSGGRLTNVDVGFDEFDQALVGDDPADPADWQRSGLIASGFANDSLALPTAPSITCYDPVTQTGTGGFGTMGLIFHGTWSGACGGSGSGGTALLRSATASCPGSAYTIPPGTILPPVATGTTYRWFPWPSPTGLQLTTYSYVPPDDTLGTCHAFRVGAVASSNAGVFKNLQAKLFGSAFPWSNLQTAVD